MSGRARFAAAATALALACCALAAAAPAEDAPAPVPRERSFDTADLERARRVAVSTLQDLGLALESGDAESGTLTASCLDVHPLRLTIVIATEGDSQISATVSADYAGSPLRDPRPTEQFLAAYEAALFPPSELD